MKEKENKNDLFDQTEDISKKIEEQMRLTEEALNNFNEDKIIRDKTYSKSMYLPRIKKKENQNIVKIKDSSLEFVNLEENFSKKPEDALFDDCCSICSSKIYYIKYMCVICKDCILCPKCEIEHEHPTLKCKFPQLSTLKDIYIYINTKNSEIKNNKNAGGFLSDIFNNKSELKLECNSYQFSMRKNSKKIIPIVVYNLSGNDFDLKKNKIIIFARNNKDLNVHTKFLEGIMNKNDNLKIYVTVESVDICKTYDFTLELFSNSNAKLKSNELKFKVEINEDNDDDKLNEFFEKYQDFPEIFIEPANIKNAVKKILENTSTKFEPINILKSLKNNKGNIEETLNELSNKKINNIL
jgi:hypothetical protein